MKILCFDSNKTSRSRKLSMRLFFSTPINTVVCWLNKTSAKTGRRKTRSRKYCFLKKYNYFPFRWRLPVRSKSFLRLPNHQKRSSWKRGCRKKTRLIKKNWMNLTFTQIFMLNFILIVECYVIFDIITNTVSDFFDPRF